MKSINYYMRKENHPVTAITVLKHEDKIARGVAVCNECDQFVKSYGRELSKDRAVKAFNNKRCYGIIRQDIFVDKKHLFKCEYMPELTEFEIDLLKDPESV